MSGFLWITYCLSILSFVGGRGSALWCYSCHSDMDEGCGNEDFRPDMHKVNMTLRDVSFGDVEGCRYCIKTTYIERHGNEIVVRSCEWHLPMIFKFASLNECHSFGQDRPEETCMCNKDFCNGVDVSRMGRSTFMLSLLLSCFVYWL